MTPEWLRRLADWWHKDAATSYWLHNQQISRAEFDHLCRGVQPHEVDPETQAMWDQHVSDALEVCETPLHDQLAAERLVAEIEQWRRGLA
ncbi:hypothetical protein [Nocardioides sp. OK12]|uniref:hypothetical protein n=1 Tax=Nocardioides sp. OK12 TaxID=2758661 RepID=UPI0021C4A8F3|nr:hypothetical protein [Nocardioides sp. OK12]